MAKFQFTTAGIDLSAAASRDYSPLPKGSYEAMVIDSAIKATKSGDGQYIELTIQIISGDHSGRRLWERLNISNPNKQTEEIASKALGQLCVAVGVDDMEDTEQLHDMPFIVELDIDRKDPTRNKIWAYKGIEGLPKVAAAKPAAAAAPAKSARPWG
jgi:hypothetical protein